MLIRLNFLNTKFSPSGSPSKKRGRVPALHNEDELSINIECCKTKLFSLQQIFYDDEGN